MWTVIIAVAAAAAGATVALRRRRAAVWRRFARRRGLELTSATQDRPMAVRGRVDGRPFELTLAASGSDRGELGVEVEEMTLEVGVEAPEGLRVGPPPLDGTGEEERSGAVDGDHALDRLARVESDDRKELDRFLTPARRQGLLRLLAMEDVDTSGMAGSTLFVRTRRGVSRLEQLEHDLCVLVSVARQLEADAAVDGRC